MNNNFFCSILFLLLSSLTVDLHAAELFHKLSGELQLNAEKLFRIHSEVFDSFVPLTHDELTTTTQHLISEAKIASFATVQATPQIKQALILFKNLSFLHNRMILKLAYRQWGSHTPDSEAITKKNLQPIKNFLRDLHGDKSHLSLADIDLHNRWRLFSLLISSPISLLRQIGFYTRMLYTNAIYQGALGEIFSGIADNGPQIASIMPSLPRLQSDLSYNADRHKLEGNIDVIIIGSGASGAVAAHEFQRAGLRVVVVESGPFVIPGAIDTTSDMRFMENQSPRLTDDGAVALLNGNAAGGGTTINLDLAFAPTLPMVRHRFHQWHEQNLIPENLWTDDEIDRAYEWVKNIFQPRLVEYSEINTNNLILMRGAAYLGLEARFYELNHYLPGSSPHEVYQKKSAFEKLLLPAMMSSENPVTLLTDCHVNHVLIKHHHARGIECSYQPTRSGFGIAQDVYGFNIKPATKITIHANTVVLAAGNLGTSAILLNSNVKNDNIGRRFVVHPFVSLMGQFDEKIRADIGVPSTIFVDHFMPTDTNKDAPGLLFEAGLGRLSLWALLMPGEPTQVLKNFSNIDHVAGFSVMLTDTPHDDNRIITNKHGGISVHYELGDMDRERMIFGIKTSAKILFAAGARAVSFNSYEYPMFRQGKTTSTLLTPDMDLDDVFSSFTLTKNKTSLLGAHMMGGNKIGYSGRDSVVDENYEVFDTSGLYVIDSSIFPSSVGANPMQTIYTCAKIFADRYLSRL